jgi:putative tricarboxylic transport membrane protein
MQFGTRERPMRRVMAALAAVLALVTAAGCDIDGDGGDLSGLRIMVPNRPGSGFDATARTVAEVLGDAQITRDVEVFNLPGADGTVGLARLVYESGNPRLLMLMGLGVVAGQHSHDSRVTLRETTPIARLMQEPGIVVVTRDSEYRTMADLVAAWRQNPNAIAFGGGSAAGGPDHVAALLVAQAAGISPVTAHQNYVGYQGGGPLLAAILSKQVDFGVSGVGEYAGHIKSGELRVLGVTSERPIPDVDAPTLQSLGYDAVFTNWRGIVAPPGLSETDVAELRQAIARLHDSAQWRAALDRNGWTDAYLEGDAFGQFVRDESDRVGDVLADLGLG